MNIREELKSNREQYWKQYMQDSITKIKESFKKYQVSELYASNFYNVKLFVKMDGGDFELGFIVNDDKEYFEENFSPMYFSKKIGVEYFLQLIIPEFEKEGINTIEVITDISSKEISESNELVIYEGIMDIS